MSEFKTIDPTELTEKEQSQFIDGWESVGGYTDDLDGCNPYPWCCPWNWAAEIVVEGETPEEWGASWWEACKDEIEELLQDEE